LAFKLEAIADLLARSAPRAFNCRINNFPRKINNFPRLRPNKTPLLRETVAVEAGITSLRNSSGSKVRFMTQTNQALRLQVNHYRSYIAISSDEMEVGFCTPEFAARIVETFNECERLHDENETLTKALQMVCLDLIRRSGGNSAHVNKLIKQYLEKAKRPEHGTRAIAFMLRERQIALDLNTRDFVRFCYSYKLSPKELKDIYSGKDIGDHQLRSLSRILGKSVEELTEVRDGFSDSELNRLARILGTSNEELAQLFES
jgi:hypothetical protein